MFTYLQILSICYNLRKKDLQQTLVTERKSNETSRKRQHRDKRKSKRTTM